MEILILITCLLTNVRIGVFISLTKSYTNKVLNDYFHEKQCTIYFDSWYSNFDYEKKNCSTRYHTCYIRVALADEIIWTTSTLSRYSILQAKCSARVANNCEHALFSHTFHSKIFCAFLPHLYTNIYTLGELVGWNIPPTELTATRMIFTSSSTEKLGYSYLKIQVKPSLLFTCWRKFSLKQ